MQAFFIKFLIYLSGIFSYCFDYKHNTSLSLIITQQFLYLEYLAWFAS